MRTSQYAGNNVLLAGRTMYYRTMREANVSVTDAEFATMGIQELVELGREAGLTGLEELSCRGDGAVVQVEVESRFDEDRLSSLEYVDEWKHVAALEESHVYIVDFTAPNLPDSVADRGSDLVGTCDPVVTDRGADMSLVGPQDAISGTVSEFQRAGVAPTLQKLGAYRGRPDPVDSLTDRQREVIQLAHEMGYYEVPRPVSTEDVAAELELDPSTVSEHLQRAERNLLSELL